MRSAVVYTIVGMGLLGLSQIAMAQTNGRVTIGEGSAQPGQQATVSWGYENINDEVSSYSFTIDFDQTVLEPETTGGNRNVVGCLSNIPADWSGNLTTCRNVADSGEIVVIIAEQSGEGIGDFLSFPTTAEIGTITFTIDAGATVGDTLPLGSTILTATDASLADVSANFEIVDGEIEVVSGPPAVLDVDPLSIPFGNVRVNQTSSEAPIAICNDGEAGAADLTITSITPSPAQFDEGAGSTCADTSFDLAPGDCCNYHVTFSPDAEAGFTGSVVIESSAGDETVTLSGQGTVSDANLTITPDSADFGELDINADAVCETFALQNSATEDSLSITDVSLGGMPIARGLAAAPFSIGADSCSGADLAPGGSCSVEVCFDPDSEGPFSDQLVVTSSANDVSADLEGVGTATADLVVTPSFGPVNLGFGLQGDTITANGNIVNNGSADAVVQCDLVDENDPPVFSTTLPLGELVTVEAGADPIPFEVSCALPEDAEDGDTFDGQIQCDVERGGVSDATTHFLTCGVSEFEPLPVPTMSNWSIALFALLMLLVGGISIRFFRT